MSFDRQIGKVYLVGAGPGDAGLMTLRGLRTLSEADLILYDYLVNPAILEFARSQAERICLGQHGRTRIWQQAEINDHMIVAARAGKTVVRLKGGDPAIFGRGAEEIEALVAQQIPFEVVPGITAASAAMAYAGIPLTHRQFASAVALVTGHEKEDEDATAPLDYSKFASFPGTLVVYMGVTTAERWVQQLIAGGKKANTPAAIVRRCSFPDQLTVTCTLADIPHKLSEHRIRPPAIIVIGEVVPLHENLSWFERLPLFGRRILVTRPEHQAKELCERFEKLGAHVLRQPAIELGPPPDWSDVDAAIGQLSSFSWIVFSSANGVQFFFQRLRDLGHDWRALATAQLAVIGPGTKEKLSSYGFSADLMPQSYVAEFLADELAKVTRGQHVLLIRASRGREILAERLRAAGAHVTQVVAYRSGDISRPDAAIAEQLATGNIDWITVTSSAIAAALQQMFGDSLHQARLVSISPITSAELRRHGFEPAAEAEEQTMNGMVQAVLKSDANTY